MWYLGEKKTNKKKTGQDRIGSDFTWERYRNRSQPTGSGQEQDFFKTLVQDQDKTGYFLQERDSTGVKIHSRVSL